MLRFENPAGCVIIILLSLRASATFCEVIMVGCAPVDGKFAEKIGADGYGEDEAEAVRIAGHFIDAE